jgi:PTS system fructose-specific IIC component
MLDTLSAESPELAGDELYASLMERERTFPSVIGEGVAVPHAYADELTEQRCAIACLKEGVDYPGGDEPVRLVFLLISPGADPKAHLTLLADIARLVAKPEVREAMLAAATPDDITGLLRSRPRDAR